MITGRYNRGLGVPGMAVGISVGVAVGVPGPGVGVTLGVTVGVPGPGVSVAVGVTLGAPGSGVTVAVGVGVVNGSAWMATAPLLVVPATSSPLASPKLATGAWEKSTGAVIIWPASGVQRAVKLMFSKASLSARLAMGNE